MFSRVVRALPFVFTSFYRELIGHFRVQILLLDKRWFPEKGTTISLV